MSTVTKTTLRTTVWSLEPDEGRVFLISRRYLGAVTQQKYDRVTVTQSVTEDGVARVEVTLTRPDSAGIWRWTSDDEAGERRILHTATDRDVLAFLAQHAAAVLA